MDIIFDINYVLLQLSVLRSIELPVDTAYLKVGVNETLHQNDQWEFRLTADKLPKNIFPCSGWLQ